MNRAGVHGATTRELIAAGPLAPGPTPAPTVERGESDSEARALARIRANLFESAAPATQVGRYFLLEEVGRGGLGVVYAAFDPQLNRRVAVKLVQNVAQADAHGHQQRLLREAQVLAQLSHPNIVAVHDAGIHGENVFVAMELVLGRTLSAWVREVEPDWRRTRDVLVAAGRGLQAAHREGVIHRDFKPANVLVGDDDRVRVVDFGLARAPISLEPEPSSSVARGDTVTRAGMLVGTPPYMAPEQLDGHISPATDQWAFCVTAYEMFYGHRPFAAASTSLLAEQIRAGVVPVPEQPGDVPPWIFAVLQRGLRPNPADRYASMVDLLAALQVDRKRNRRRSGTVLAPSA